MADFDQIKKELDSIKKTIKRENEPISAQEFVDVLSEVVSVVVAFEKNTKQSVDTEKQTLDEKKQEIERRAKEVENRIEELERQPGPQGEKGDSPSKEQIVAIARDALDELKNELRGEDGRTPQKGVDFFTQQDIQEIQDRTLTDVLSQVTAPDISNSVARGLEGLEGDERLDYEALKNRPSLDQSVARVLSQQGNRITGGGMLSVFDSNGKVGSGTSIKFTGSGVNSVSHDGHQATVDISGGSGGSAITLDLGDDGANESSGLTEIATTNDTNNIVTEPSADKMLIDMSKNWPTADDVPDSAVDHDQTTNFVSNEHIDHTSVSITAGTGLSGGGDISSSRTLNVDNLNTIPDGLTSGSVVFSDGTNLSEDNSNLFWDNGNKRLGIGTSSPDSRLTVEDDSTSAFNVRNTSGQNLIEADTTNGKFVVRQPGGTAGTDEVQISHDGTDGFIDVGSGNLKSNSIITSDTGGSDVAVGARENSSSWAKLSGGGQVKTFTFANGQSFSIKEASAGDIDTTVGTHYLTVKSSGNVMMSGDSKNDTPNAQLGVTTDDSSQPTSIFKGASSQTANLTEWQDTGGSTLASVDGSGNISANNITGGGTNLETEFSKSITIESPTASEDISIFETGKAITITEIRAVIRGSSTPDVTWTIRHNTDRSAAGNEVVTGGTTTSSTTTGDTVTTFNDADVPANSWLWVETTATSGTVDELILTVKYTID